MDKRRKKALRNVSEGKGLADSASSYAQRLAAERGNSFIANQGKEKKKKDKGKKTKKVGSVGRLLRKYAGFGDAKLEKRK